MLLPRHLLVLSLLTSPVLAGVLPPAAPYVVTGGYVEGEAENYHAKAAGNGDEWFEAPTNPVVPTGVTFENATGAGNLFMQVQPDDGPGSVPYSGAGAGPSIDYYIQFTIPGTYRLYLRWDGHDGASDSIYAGITELADGIGGTNADWYEDFNHTTSDFGQQKWDGSGQAEVNVATPAQNAMTFTIPGAGIYTLRVVAREDGVALDAFRIQLASMPDPNPVAVTSDNIIFGQDDFTYANGSIAGSTGGTNWDLDNTTNNGGFIGFTRSPSNWDAVFGVASVLANKLTTRDSGAKREYGSPSEFNGSVNQDGSTRYKSVYYRVKMTRAAGATWGGISSYDFATERIFFGVADAVNPASGVREFMIGENGVTYSGVPAVDGQTYTLVTKIDFVNDQLSLWVDPDLSQPESTPNAVRPYLGDNWSSAVRLGSGGTAATTWDELVVGSSWSAVQRAYPQTQPVSGPDIIVGIENFDYDTNGNIAGHDSGSGWDFDNDKGDTFVGRTGLPSNWDNVEGNPYLFSNRLATWNSSAKREYNSVEASGSFSSAATSEYGTIYYRFEMHRSAADVTWSGMSVYENNVERLMFGVPFATNPGSGQRELGIHNLGANQWSYTGMQPVAGERYQIVAKVDYAAGLASIFINPDLTAGEPTPQATLAFTNPTTALRFGSGGDSPTYWDRVVVATSWSAVQTVTYPVATPASGVDLVIGTDGFDYADGNINSRQGGQHWDFRNTAPLAYSNEFSDWDVSFGSPNVNAGALSTQESGATREFNGIEAEGAINDASASAFDAVYVRVEMTRAAGAAWSGLSLYDFGAERFLFGVPFAVNPESGVREFAVHDLATGHSFSGVAPVDGQTYTLVAKLDLAADTLSLWVDPDLDLPEGSNTPFATRAYTGANWITALRLGSGGSAATTWDNVAAGTSWRSIQSAFGPPTAFADTITMRHTKKVLYDVRRNDAGAGSVELLTSPSFGTASLDVSGRLFYHHTTGTPASDSLTYRLIGIDGQNSAPTTVTFSFSSDLRIANDTSVVPLTAPATGLAVVDSTPGINFTAPSCFAAVPGSTDKILVGERNGKIWLIPDIHAAAPTKQLFIDLAAVVNARTALGETFHDDGNELGLKGLTLHPQFATNGQFFVTYNFRISGAMHARVSRWTAVSGNLDLGDTASEQPFITQPNPSSIHNIDSCHFGPDGYLYWSAGDAGGLNDGNNNSQRIDKDFWAGIFRIDVDRLPGNLEPNAHASIVLDGGSQAFFKVPADNPFVGATTFNGVALSGTLRTEIYAIGFRNPWQFSWDPQTGEMWAGDVGLDSWEEVDLVVPGGNYGWSFFEGTAQRIAPPGGYVSEAPLWTYFHGGGVLEGRSVTGGLVYRGTRYPTLTGKYVFGDFVSGHIWTLTPNGANPPTVERVTGEAGVVAFMLDPDPATGDILMLDYGDGKVRRLTTPTIDTTFPAKLSDTGLFADLSDLSLNPGIERYDVNLPFWSDYARKTRWFMLPNDTDTFGFVEEGNWDLPTGALFIKHFDYDLTRGNPATAKRLETRLLVKNDTGSYGVSYRWNETGTEAFLVDDAGEDFDMNINISGTPTNVHWRIPSRSECLACHTAAGGHGLSFETRQLNRTGTLGGFTDNYLQLLASAGYLSNPPAQVHNLPKFVVPTDNSQTLETRARSWLAVNCSYCHQAGGTGIGVFDMRPELSLMQSGMIDGHVGNVQQAHHKALVRGDHTASVIWSRLAADGGYTRMPPLATAVVDPEGVQLVMDWINASAGRQTYAEWRFAHFGSSSSPEGDPAFDADADGVSNYDEFLGLTLPLAGNSRAQPAVGLGSTNLTVQFPNNPGRMSWIESSTNLLNWSLWNVPGNNGVPLPNGATRSFTAPIDGPMRFFRLRVQEQ